MAPVSMALYRLARPVLAARLLFLLYSLTGSHLFAPLQLHYAFLWLSIRMSPKHSRMLRRGVIGMLVFAKRSRAKDSALKIITVFKRG